MSRRTEEVSSCQRSVIKGNVLPHAVIGVLAVMLHADHLLRDVLYCQRNNIKDRSRSDYLLGRERYEGTVNAAVSVFQLGLFQPVLACALPDLHAPCPN